MRSVVILDHSEDTGTENEENIEKMNESFISMKGILCIFKKSRERFSENSFKWTNVLN